MIIPCHVDGGHVLQSNNIYGGGISESVAITEVAGASSAKIRVNAMVFFNMVFAPFRFWMVGWLGCFK